MCRNSEICEFLKKEGSSEPDTYNDFFDGICFKTHPLFSAKKKTNKKKPCATSSTIKNYNTPPENNPQNVIRYIYTSYRSQEII